MYLCDEGYDAGVVLEFVVLAELVQVSDVEPPLAPDVVTVDDGHRLDGGHQPAVVEGVEVGQVAEAGAHPGRADVGAVRHSQAGQQGATKLH